jgi:hypothetical protein
MFCTLRPVSRGNDGVGSLFHVLRSLTHFRRYQGRRVLFSCFALPDPFSVVPRASGPVFIFCAPGLMFGSIEGVGTHFHVLRSWTHFRRYGRRLIQFSCFAPKDPFSAVPTASGPIFVFYAPGHVFGGTEGVASRFHVLRSRTRFRRNRRRRVQFSCFAFPDSYSAVPRASCPVFMFSAPGPAFGGADASRPVFMFCAPGPIFDGTKGIGSCFHILHSCTHFRRYRGRRVMFSCFALSDSFSAVPRVSCPVFMFCARGPVLEGIEAVVSRFRQY